MSSVAAVKLSVVHATWRATWATICVDDGDGATGLAECSGGNPPLEMRRQLVGAESVLAGLPLDEARLAVRRGAAGPLPASLNHGLELALADLQARVDGTPLDLLPPARCRGEVPVYANINRANPVRTSENLAGLGARAVAEGFTAVKLAPFDDADAAGGLAHLRALRRAIGPDVELMVDCHTRLSFEDVVRILPALEDLGVVWLEDAVPLSDIDRWLDLAGRTHLPLAGGEQATELADVEPLLESGVLSYVLPDVRIAGVAGCHAILNAALRRGVGASIHNPAGPVATVASLLVAASVPEFQRLEYAYGEVPWRGALLQPPERVVDARLAVPEGPGLGVCLSAFSTPEPPAMEGEV